MRDYCEQAEQRHRQDLISGEGLFAPLSFPSHYFPYFSLIRSEVAPSMQLDDLGFAAILSRSVYLIFCTFSIHQSFALV